MNTCVPFPSHTEQYGFGSHGVRFNVVLLFIVVVFVVIAADFLLHVVRYVAYHSIFSHQSSSHRCGMAPPPPTTVDENEKMIA